MSDTSETLSLMREALKPIHVQHDWRGIDTGRMCFECGLIEKAEKGSVSLATAGREQGTAIGLETTAALDPASPQQSSPALPLEPLLYRSAREQLRNAVNCTYPNDEGDECGDPAVIQVLPIGDDALCARHLRKAKLSQSLAAIEAEPDPFLYLSHVKIHLANKVMEAGDVQAWHLIHDRQEELFFEEASMGEYDS